MAGPARRVCLTTESAKGPWAALSITLYRSCSSQTRTRAPRSSAFRSPLPQVETPAFSQSPLTLTTHQSPPTTLEHHRLHVACPPPAKFATLSTATALECVAICGPRCSPIFTAHRQILARRAGQETHASPLPGDEHHAPVPTHAPICYFWHVRLYIRKNIGFRCHFQIPLFGIASERGRLA
jgi:hypothetical protein